MNEFKIAPLHPFIRYVDERGNLTKEAYEYQFSTFKRVGGAIGPLNADTLQKKTWEAPGQIGKDVPNTGQFLSLKAIGDVELVPEVYTPADETDPKPESLGTLLIKPETSGTMDNVVIGEETAAKATFTELVAETSVTFTTTDTVVIVPDVQGSLNNMNIGYLTPRYGGFSLLQSTGGFGCNGASPQTAYTVGGWVPSTAATNSSPYGFTEVQANDIVAKLNLVIQALTNNGIIT